MIILDAIVRAGMCIMVAGLGYPCSIELFFVKSKFIKEKTKIKTLAVQRNCEQLQHKPMKLFRRTTLASRRDIQSRKYPLHKNM